MRQIKINWKSPRFISTATALLVISIIGVSLGVIITRFSFGIPLALVFGAIVFIITLVNTDAGLAILIFSMLLSPEIIIGQVPGRDIVIRLDDLLLITITFAWLAKTAINKGLALFIKTPLNKIIGAYVLICLIATLRGTALGYVVPEKGFFYVLRYVEYS
jgi:hypothetical protein